MTLDLSQKLTRIESLCRIDATITGQQLFDNWCAGSDHFGSLHADQQLAWEQLAIEKQAAARSTLTAIAALRELREAANEWSEQRIDAAFTEIASHFENV